MRCSMNRLFIPIRIFISSMCLILAACANTLEQGGAIETTPTQRRDIGSALEERLLKILNAKPIFSSKQKLNPMEIKVLTSFAESLPSGTFIFGGHPSFLIELKYNQWRVTKKRIASVIGIRYRVALKRADNKDIISLAEQSGNCNESEALLTYPTRCSILRPIVLRTALEKL